MAKTEAKIVVSARDDTAPALMAIQARINALLAPMQRVQAMMTKPMQIAGLDRVGGALGGLKNAMQGVPIAGTLFAAGGMALATKSLIDNSVAAHDALGGLHDLSAAFKVSTKDLQVFAEIGADSGVGVEQIAKAFGFLQQKIEGARTGEKSDLTLMAKVGITTKDLEGDAASVFRKVSDVFKASTLGSDDAAKIDIAKQMFGKAGIGMIPMLEEGGAKYEEVFGKMMAEGRIFSAEQIKTADGVGDAWGASMRRIGALQKTIGLTMSPMLDAISESINKMLSGSARTELIDTFKKLGESIAIAAPKFISRIPEIVNGLASVFGTIQKIGQFVGWEKLILGGVLFIASPFVAATMTMVGALGRLAISLGGVIVRMGVMGGMAAMGAIRGVQGIALAMRVAGLSAAASWAMALGPLLLVGAAAAGVAYLIYSNWGGIKAFIGGVWDGLLGSIAPLLQALSPIGDAISGLIGWFGGLFGSTQQSTESFESWAEAGKVAGALLGGVFRALLVPIMAVIDAIKLVVAGVNFLRGGEFKFESSLVKSFSGPEAPKNPTEPAKLSEPAPLPPAFANPMTSLPETRIAGSLPSPKIATQRVDVGGRLDIRVTADSQVKTERVESKNRAMEYSVSSGSMFGVTG